MKLTFPPFVTLGVALIAFQFFATAEKPGEPAQALPAGVIVSEEKVVFQLDFSDPTMRSILEKSGGIITNDGPDGRPAVKFSVPVGATGKSMAHFVLPVENLRGARIKMTGKVRAESIESPDPALPLPGYLGGKCQLYLNTPSRGKRWLEARALHGTFPWREVGMLGGVMDDATEAQVRIGVEGATGSLWISELKLTIIREKATRPRSTAAQTTNATTEKRGFMSPNRFAAKDFDDLASWNVNVVRWQMGRKADDNSPYDTWLNQELDDLALALDAAAARGIKLVVDLHAAPGGRLPDRTFRMYLEKEYHDAFIDTWQRIARRFKGHPGLWAYDLINEPVQNYPSPAGLPDWLGLQVETGKAIREIDPVTPIVIEVDQWDSPDSFLWLEPVDLPNVIYQAHMYWPWEFTHQGIKTNQGGADGKDLENVQVVYPGTIQDQPFDKEALRRYLAPVREFQQAYGVPIFIGEFSTVRWSPGGSQYLDDCISIFEEYGWDWTYHAFRESPVWSVEHANLPQDRKNHPLAASPTDRRQILQKWLLKNQKARSEPRKENGL